MELEEQGRVDRGNGVRGSHAAQLPGSCPVASYTVCHVTKASRWPGEARGDVHVERHTSKRLLDFYIYVIITCTWHQLAALLCMRAHAAAHARYLLTPYVVHSQAIHMLS
jgi:hypothetical protein